MGIEPFLLSSSLIGVLAQRLVRVAQPRDQAAVHLRGGRATAPQSPAGQPPPTLYRPGDDILGGYRGRSGIYELIMVDEQMRTMIHDGASEQQIEHHARRSTP
ncbi:general secretory pathway protein E [mine drainage metagenome]|uniref:General secretory pathway protein E n=1 Tax=mine drainage metagenome TaxID=410659 RepID=T1BUX6_9ZZZZ